MTNDTSTAEAQSVPTRDTPLYGVVLLVGNAAPTLRVVRFDDKPIIVGRGEGSTLIIDDKRMSRQHAEISRDDRGWLVRDLGSHNGTKVDGRKIEGKDTTRGSIVRVGESVLLLDEISRFGQPHSLLGEEVVISPRLQVIFDRVRQSGRDGLHTLILGETGVGKELLARAHHEASLRASGPFRTVNCAALAESLLDDELFGHARGAFSGANQAREGLFESANNGTIFLDEIGDMPPAVQSKVLRVLEDGEVRRLGENDVRHTRMQVVSATSRPLRERMASGLFRTDLYYRIARQVVEVPPLRERREEIPFLIALKLRQTGAVGVEASLFEACLVRPWPGNVRELLGAVESASSTARASSTPPAKVAAKHLLPNAGLPVIAATAGMEPGRPLVPSREAKEEAVVTLYQQGLDVETIMERVGVSEATVRRYLRKHGLK